MGIDWIQRFRGLFFGDSTRLDIFAGTKVDFAAHASRAGAARFGGEAEVREDADVELESAHAHSFKNRTELMQSSQCGCFHCGAIFRPATIEEWHDGDETGFCPHCGIDALIGSAAGYPLTKDFLDRMNKYWF